MELIQTNFPSFATEPRSKFRNARNVLLYKGLFLETRPYNQETPPIYTLRDIDHTRPNGEFYPSLYVIYMKEADVTEYQFATKYLESWNHWRKLCETNWFKPYIEEWRKELELKITSEAINRLKEAATNPNSKNYVEINRYLASAGWKPKDSKGRPTKAQIERAAREEVLNSNEIKNDFERVFGLTPEYAEDDSKIPLPPPQRMQ